MGKKKNKKLIYDGHYFDGKNAYDIFKNENGKSIITKSNGKKKKKTSK